MNRAPFTEVEHRPAPRLTQDDVRRLLDEPSEMSRVAVIEKVSRDFTPELLGPVEMTIAEQIFRLLVQDSSLRIRQAMADNLALNPFLPRDVAMTLAKDVESVAIPVLTMSEVLSDDELMSLIQHTEEIWRYMAIARRGGISEHVSAALIETDVPVVLKELLDNDSALIGERSYLKLMDRASQDEDFARRIVRRPGLPLAVVEKLTHVVSDELARQLKERLPLDDEQLAAGMRHAGEETTLDLLTSRADRSATAALVNQLFDDDRLTASLIINALCNGNVDFFEMALARLANIHTENAHVLVHDKGKLGFRALYNKSQLPSTMYKAVRLVFDSVKEVLAEGIPSGSNLFSNHVVGRMLEAAENEQIENLSYVLAIIRQRPQV